jgi:FAD/FMN-containing dehydrogenase
LTDHASLTDPAPSPWRTDYRSWGRVIHASHQVVRPSTRDEAARCLAAADHPILAYGCGRSYGDVALNPDGRLIDCRGLDRFIDFDRTTGLLTCEAGVTLADILAVACRPEADGTGWMLPVTPGTRFVTLAGAIANDVHGKNHHTSGSFGSHVASLELARTDGTRRICTPTDHPDLFAATIGGLGLTGLILSATIRMRRVPGLAVEAEDIRFNTLSDFFALADESDAAWEYTAAWIDCLARGRSLGRGIYSRARHIPGRGTEPPPRQPRMRFPGVPPFSLVTPLTVRPFNAAYWRKLGPSGRSNRTGSYEKVFYPLDAMGDWNRVYGPQGFYQFQCRIPPNTMHEVVADLLRITAASGQASALSVLKLFGSRTSPGLLSFPAPGATLALDFPNRGPTTATLLGRLEQVVVQAGGRLYPAKDGLMQAATFQAGYPALDRFLPQIDPGFASSFGRRVELLPNHPSRRSSDPVSAPNQDRTEPEAARPAGTISPARISPLPEPNMPRLNAPETNVPVSPVPELNVPELNASASPASVSPASVSPTPVSPAPVSPVSISRVQTSPSPVFP